MLLQLTLPLLSCAAAQAQEVSMFRSNYTEANSQGEAIAASWDGNFYVTGAVVAPAPEGITVDALLLKISPAGDTLWKRTFGTPHKLEVGRCIATPQVNTILIGGTGDETGGSGSGAAFLTKLDGSGNPVWYKTYDMPGARTTIADILPMTDGYALCGSYTDLASGNTDAWLLKTDQNGDVVWSKKYGGADDDDVWQIERAPGGGFMLGGGSYTYRTGTQHTDAWLIRTNSLGEAQWIKHYGAADTLDWIWSMASVGNPLEPAGYIFTGVTNRSPDNTNSELFLARVDTAGEVLWQQAMPGNFGFREGLAIEQTPHHTFYLVAAEQKADGSHALLGMNIDSNGTILNELQYNSTTPEILRPHSIIVTVFGDVYVTGRRTVDLDDGQTFVARISGYNGTGVPEIPHLAAPVLYPNPARAAATISCPDAQLKEVVVLDAFGSVLQEHRHPGAHAQVLQLTNYAAGTYFVEVTTDRQSFRLKLVVQ